MKDKITNLPSRRKLKRDITGLQERNRTLTLRNSELRKQLVDAIKEFKELTDAILVQCAITCGTKEGYHIGDDEYAEYTLQLGIPKVGLPYKVNVSKDDESYTIKVTEVPETKKDPD